MKKRSEQNSKYHWSLHLMYQNDVVLEQDLQYIKKETEKLVKLKGHLVENATNLLVGLNLYHAINRKMENVYVYASHLLDQDHGNNESQIKMQQIKTLYTKMASDISFFIPELLTVNKMVITNYITENQYLKPYTKFLDDVYEDENYILTSKEERIMSMASPLVGSAYNIYNTLTSVDLKFKAIEDKFGKDFPMSEDKWPVYATNEDRRFRKQAFESLLSGYSALENTFASLYINHVQSLIFKTNVRNYENPRQMALYNNQIDEKIYDTLIKVTSENLDLNHDYLKIKQKLLKLDELHMYDMYVPLISGVDREYEYLEAKKLVYYATAPLGEEYQEIIKRAFNEKWIDVYPNAGKRGGAYSGGSYDSRPYVLLNYTNKINDVFTLAHELGHSAHSYLTNQNQPYQYSHYKIFVAEIASIVNELLLFDYLINNGELNNKNKMYLYNYLIDQFRATIYRQTMFAEFEHESKQALYKNEEVSCNTLNDMYYQLNRKYFGENVVIDEEIKYEWMRIPHFYMNYYVYQYATSYCVAIKVAREILKGNEEMRLKYLEFLKTGDYKKPLDLIAELGINMFDETVYTDAFTYLTEILNQFSELYVIEKKKK